MSPVDLATHAARSGMRAIGVADCDGLAGGVRLAKACAQAGITYIPGVDLALIGPGLPGWEPALGSHGRSPGPVGQAYLTNGAARMTFIATNNAGLASLCRLTSAAYGLHEGLACLPQEHHEQYRHLPGVDSTTIQTHLGGQVGVYALFGPHSPLSRLLRHGQHRLARNELRRWMHVLGPDQLLIGLSYYGRRQDDQLIRAACALGDAMGVRVVVNQVPRFIHPEDGVVADVLDAIRQQVPMGSSYPRRSPKEGQWGDPDAIAYTFAQRPDALSNTLAIGHSCVVDWQLGKSRVPHFGHWESQPDGALAMHLRQRSVAGVIERLGIDPDHEPNHPISQRLDDELAVIIERGLASYFLTVGAIVQRIREQGILVACRGSAAGSLVTYALRISDVNPMTYGLLMERFLHRYRTDLPDIDIDVESHRREEIQRDLINTWGANRITGLAMVSTFRTRGAIRETGKALGLSAQEIDLAAKAFPRTRASRIGELLESLPEIKGLGLTTPTMRQLFTLAQRLDGIPRNVSLHPCGLILADSNLGDIAPLIPSGPRQDGNPIAMIPYDKDDIEDLGLVKLDILGVRMFSAMAHARDLAHTTRGRDIDIDAIDTTKDDATFAMIRRSDTIGMFQIESPGQRELIGRLLPTDTHDLVIDISLFRPGPVKGEMIDPFLRRRSGQEPTNLPDILRPALEETHGVIVYHEQVIRCISAITGCDLGQADVARRNLGNAYALPDMEHWIRTWCARRGLDQPTTDWLWTSLAQFASFGFCKAHAAAFAIPTYRSAWMKANIMPEFLAGLLTHDPGMYPARLICAEARRHGIELLGVDINASQPTYYVTTVDDPLPPGITLPGGDYGQAPQRANGQAQRWAIRTAFGAIRGIDRHQIDTIMANQPFTSIADVRARAGLHAPVAMDLARVGAFDAIAPGLSRGDIQLEVEERWASPSKTARTLGHAQGIDDPAQLPLFSQAGPPIGLPGISPANQIRAEVDIMGMDVSGHIIDFYLKDVEGITRSVDLAAIPDGQRVRVIGAKVATQTPPTSSGQRIIFVTLDDNLGLIDITFFPRSHDQCARTIFTHWLIMVEGRVTRRGSLPTVIGERAWPITTNQSHQQLWHASPGSVG